MVLSSALGLVAGMGAPAGASDAPAGESDEWRVEFVDRVPIATGERRARLRATSRLEGTSSTLLVDNLHGRVRAIQVYRSSALITSYLARGWEHVVLLDLTEQREVAEFVAYLLLPSPDSRYLLYRVGYGQGEALDPRLILLDLEDDHTAVGEARARCDPLWPCGTVLGTSVYQTPPMEPRPDGLGVGSPSPIWGVTWDLPNERVLLIAKGEDDLVALLALSLAGESPEVVCRVPIHGRRVEGEFSGSVRRSVSDLRYEAAADVAVIDVEDQNSVKSEYRVSLAEACAGQGRL